MTPSTIALSPGSRLSFKNSDPFAHSLYESGNDKWAPNPTAPGSAREWVAGAPGVHEIQAEVPTGQFKGALARRRKCVVHVHKITRNLGLTG